MAIWFPTSPGFQCDVHEIGRLANEISTGGGCSQVLLVVPSRPGAGPLMASQLRTDAARLAANGRAAAAVTTQRAV